MNHEKENNGCSLESKKNVKNRYIHGLLWWEMSDNFLVNCTVPMYLDMRDDFAVMNSTFLQISDLIIKEKS